MTGAERDWDQFVAQRMKGQMPQSGQVITIGSSHMACWENVDEALPMLTVYNFGIGGTTMEDAAANFAKQLVISTH